MKEIPIVPGRGLNTKFSIQQRLDFLELNQHPIEAISSSELSIDAINNKIESYVGSTEIPLGLVGPLLMTNPTEKSEELVYCLTGTLEGALVMSMNRGAKAISNSGGFSASIKWQKMTRVPMFIFGSKSDAKAFCTFTEKNFDSIKKEAEKYSNHATLLSIENVQDKEIVHLKFVYSTGDASGQNMTTTCTWHALLFLLDLLHQKTQIKPIDFVIEGNGSSDKKISISNLNSGRGINVSSECFLREEVINQILRTSSNKLLQFFEPSKKLCKENGMVGYNINVANAIASIFVATGQDLACIHESGVGFLQIEKTERGLLIQLNLPNLVIGTVGGGTLLPKQKEALNLMNCLGVGKVERFAKLICGFAMGLELSTYAAIVSGEFAKAHEKLGRNKPINWLLRSQLNESFIKTFLKNIPVNQISSIKIANEDLIENGILTNISKKINKKLIGFIPLELSGSFQQNGTEKTKLLIKSKAIDEEVIKGLHLISASIDPKLSDLFKELKKHLEFTNSHLKEIELYEYLNKIHFPYIPHYYGSLIDSKREIYLFIQELMESKKLKLFNTENQPELWEKPDILKTLEVITKFHNEINPQELSSVQAFEPWKSAELYKKLVSLLINDTVIHPNKEKLIKLHTEIDEFQEIHNSIQLKKTIVHNDFNSRNIAIDLIGNPKIYDWELAVIDFKHRDIVEFLSFVLKSNFSKKELMTYFHFHHQLNSDGSWMEYAKAYKYSLKVYIACRLSLYEVSGIVVKYDFSKRVINNAFRMLEMLEENE